MKYIAIFDIPDDCGIGCATAYISQKGKETYEAKDFEKVYAIVEPLSDIKAEVFEKFEAVGKIMNGLGISNAYDMPSFWIHDHKDFRVIPTKYHQGYRQALENVEREVRLRFGFAEREDMHYPFVNPFEEGDNE